MDFDILSWLIDWVLLKVQRQIIQDEKSFN